MSDGCAVLAVDPGPHTGLALFGPDGTYVRSSTLELESMWGGERLLFLGVAGAVREAARAPGGAVIVVENYLSASGLRRDGAFALQVIGWVRGLSYLYGCQPVVRPAAARTPFLGDAADLLRDVGKAPTRHPHERDAVAHGLAQLSIMPKGRPNG